MPILVKVVEKKVYDKKRSKTYVSKMVTLPKAVVELWGDVRWVQIEMDERGRLVISPVPDEVARERAGAGRRAGA